MRIKRTVCLSTIALLGLAPSFAFAQESDDVEKKKVRVVVKSSECDGEGCAEGEHKSIWVDESKKVHVVGGEANVFFGEEDATGSAGNHFVFRSGGDNLFGPAGGGFLGVQLTELTDALRNHFGVRPGVGVMVGDVVDGSPAERAGFEAGDIVVAVDGKQIEDGAELTRKVRALEDGETAGFEVVRDGSNLTLNATIEERQPRARFFSADGGEGQNLEDFVFRTRQCEEGADCTSDHTIEKIIKMQGGTGDMKVLHLDGLDLDDLECSGDGSCEIMVECENDDCACTVDGETVPCSQLEQ